MEKIRLDKTQSERERDLLKLIWSLYKKDGTYLKPLEWVGGNQEKSVNEIVNEFRNLKKIREQEIKKILQKILLFLSACGSGKSAILLNVAKEMGRSIVVVPSILYQEQYKNDYFGDSDKHILKNDGSKLKIGTMIGRDNFVCRYLKDHVDKGEFKIGDLIIFDKNNITCAHSKLPCNRKLGKGERRIYVGHECPYFVPSPYSVDMIEELNETGELEEVMSILKCDKIEHYKGVDGDEYALFVRKGREYTVCEYYRQFYNYLSDYADVIIFNKWKWEIETEYGRKPLVDIECVDECDEFLNGLNKSIDISNYMINRLYHNKSEEERVKLLVEKISNELQKIDKEIEEIKNEMGNERLENRLKDLERFEKSKETKIKKMEKETEDLPLLSGMKADLLSYFDNLYQKIKPQELVSKKGVFADISLLEKIKKFVNAIYDLDYEGKIKGEEIDDDKLLEMNRKLDILFKYADKATMTTRESVNSVSICYNIPYPDLMLKDLLSKSCDNILFSSATSLPEETLNMLFGLKYDKVILGRQDQPGRLEIRKPKKIEMYDVTHNFLQDEATRGAYNILLVYIVVGLNEIGKTLVLTPAKKHVTGLVDYLKKNNANIVVDFSGEEYASKGGVGNEITISYRMKRGIDLRDELCRVVVWAKLPFPDLSDGYNKALFNRFEQDTWTILRHIAEKECIQGVCRGLRNDQDWCVFATPDIRAYNVVEKWWIEQLRIKQ